GGGEGRDLDRAGGRRRLGRPAHPRSADPFRNHAVRRNELHSLARPDHLPAAFVYLPMVEVTKREKVGLVVLFVVFLKTLGIPDLARLVGQIAELFDREAPGVVDPVLLVDVLALLAHLLAEVADDRGRLVADPA